MNNDVCFNEHQCVCVLNYVLLMCLIVLSQNNWHLRLDKFGSCQFSRNATKHIKLKMILQTMSVYPYVSVLTRQRNWHLSELTRHNPIKVSNCCQRHVLWRYTCFRRRSFSLVMQILTPLHHIIFFQNVT